MRAGVFGLSSAGWLGGLALSNNNNNNNNK